MVPARVGPWRVVQVLATGGFGVVYEVEHVDTHERAALKVLHAEHVTSSELVARFLREAKILRTLAHPSIVRLVDAGVDAAWRPYLCMELLAGIDLESHLARVERLGMTDALACFAPVCEALAAAHAHGIVHRDVKAANVMLCAGRVVLVDFGIARIADDAATPLTATHSAIGTPSCMAPEQIEGRRPDRRTDVYALGALLFHLLTGRPPFADPSPTMTQYLHQHARRPRASLVARVPSSFDDVITRAMAIDPERRYPDSLALLAAARQAAHEGAAPDAVAVVETVALLVSVTELAAIAAHEAAVFADLESVLPRAERFLGSQGVALAIDLGQTGLFAAPRAQVAEPVALAHALYAHLAARPDGDPRIAIRVCVHHGPATYAGAAIQPGSLLRPRDWRLPDGPAVADGVWETSDEGGPARRLR